MFVCWELGGARGASDEVSEEYEWVNRIIEIRYLRRREGIGRYEENSD